jgi:hypothetical protein
MKSLLVFPLFHFCEVCFVIHNHYLILTRQKIDTSCDTNENLIIASFTDSHPVENFLKMRQILNLRRKTTAYLLDFLNKCYMQLVRGVNIYQNII